VSSVGPHERITSSTSPPVPAGKVAEDYYLKNFHALVGFVEETYADCLLPDERDWLLALRRCSGSAQRLYVRLIGRKRSVFRLARLHYPEIDDLASAAAELVSSELATAAPPATLAELLGAFTRREIVERLSLGASARATRQELTEHLLLPAAAAEEPAMCKRLLADERCLILHGHAHLSLFRLCFFGNLYQDLSEFVLSDLGTVRYESYAMPAGERAFGNRSQIDAHLRYFECEWLFETGNTRDEKSLQSLVAQLPVPGPGDVSLRRRTDRLCNRIARQFERLDLHDEALTLYAASRRPPARERRVRLLLAAERTSEALTLCEAMRCEPRADSELQFVERVYRRLQREHRRAGTSVRAPVRVEPRVYRPPTTRLVLRRNPAWRRNVRVERVARRYFQRHGECHYVENRLVCGMLGLLAWDIIFMPVPGAFFHPFQNGPADFREAGFRAAREDAFAARLAELEQPDGLSARVMSTWQSRYGIANPLVQWSALNEVLIERALSIIPARHWQSMFTRVLADTRENTSGLPDLTLFRPDGSYEFIEIKGPGDALQSNQRRWLEYFSRHGIPARVVNIVWSDADAEFDADAAAESGA